MRWVWFLVALLALGPIAGAMVGRLRASDGSGETTLLLSSGLLGGVLALVGVGALMGAAGLLGGRWFGVRAGQWCAGFVLAWAAYRSGRMERVLVLEPDGLGVLAFEGLLVTLVVACVATAMALLASKGDAERERWLVRAKAMWLDKGALIGMGATAAAMVLIAAVVVANDLRGQAVIGLALGGVLAGALGGVAGTAAGGGRTPAWAPIVTGGALAGLIAPIAAMLTTGDVRAAAIAGDLRGFAMAQPLDFASAAFLGVPLGARWGLGRMDRHAERAPARA